jgi:hypothetical protein
MVRIIADEQTTPALFDLSDFEVVDGILPSNWIADSSDETFELTPKSWTEPGFWERFFDGDPEALNTFRNERQTIVDCGSKRSDVDSIARDSLT